ncbi:MAG TPA: AraC family transcriptional regulator [Alphaproteobacteria bacterium]|jgi:AraC-like DNA-binding protein|nr:AraC family transcriptional regulator [Alphaproteobacteria bacterium]
MRALSDANTNRDIPPTLNFHFGSEYMLAGGSYVPDSPVRITVFTLIAGDATIEMDGNAISFSAGQSVLIDAGRTYIYMAKPDKAHLISWADSDPLPGRPPAAQHGRVFKTTPRIEALHELGYGAGPSTARGHAEISRYLGHALLIECTNAAIRDRQPARPGRAIPRLERVLCADLRRDWTAPDMASAISLSQRTLTRRLRTEAGLSAMALLWKVRVRQGVALLTRSDLNGTNVAELCGFKSAYHFSRRIKEATGMSPTALRSWASNSSLSERRDLLASL